MNGVPENETAFCRKDGRSRFICYSVYCIHSQYKASVRELASIYIGRLLVALGSQPGTADTRPTIPGACRQNSSNAEKAHKVLTVTLPMLQSPEKSHYKLRNAKGNVMKH